MINRNLVTASMLGALTLFSLHSNASEPDLESGDFLSPTPSSTYKGYNYRFPLGYSKLVKSDTGTDTDNNTDDDDNDNITGGGKTDAFIAAPSDVPIASFPTPSSYGNVTFLPSSNINYGRQYHTGYPFEFLTDGSVFTGNKDGIIFNFNVYPDDHLDFTLDDYSTFRVLGGDSDFGLQNAYQNYSPLLFENMDGGPLYNQNGQLISKTGLIKFHTNNAGGTNSRDFVYVDATLPPGNYKVSNYSERHGLSSAGYQNYISYFKELEVLPAKDMPDTNVIIDDFFEVITGEDVNIIEDNSFKSFELLVDGNTNSDFIQLHDRKYFDEDDSYTAYIDITIKNGGILRIDIPDRDYNLSNQSRHIMLETLDNDAFYDRYGKLIYRTKVFPLSPKKDVLGADMPYTHYETDVQLMAGKYRLAPQTSPSGGGTDITEITVTPADRPEFPENRNRIAISDLTNAYITDGIIHKYTGATDHGLQYLNFNYIVEGDVIRKYPNTGGLPLDPTFDMQESITFEILEESIIEAVFQWNTRADSSYRNNYKYVIENINNEVVAELDIIYSSGSFTATSEYLPPGVYKTRFVDTVGNQPSQYVTRYLKAFK
ncbi:hypothetical protein L1267_16855 [Pseudoalteromonas sp. OFAV1]|uniref:hypothetical protein n=1 Tax=Pseudoalteromonas sp. OFAV1 TaxID=2908892 RepID=UPI001F2536C2|nr:hypothetical protein [Pseudoalteromonas sp. OFAV1]MCF2902047.1 hypothetical protein [Pseudoalteromonas sp. OFAV1]